jgi:hypothetical protein
MAPAKAITPNPDKTFKINGLFIVLSPACIGADVTYFDGVLNMPSSLLTLLCGKSSALW